jgi:chromosome segregation ATPase
VSRGDGAVLAASREAAAREAAQAKLAQLERVVSRLRRELAVARSSIKEYTERVRAKEEVHPRTTHTDRLRRWCSRQRRWHSHTCSRRRRVGGAGCEQPVTQPVLD